MQIIKHLTDLITEELEGACGYAKCAVKYKDDNTALAKLYYDLSIEEMQHVDRLHNQVVTEIRNYRNTHGEPPVEMQAVYDYVHDHHIEKAAKIKAMQMQYRGQ